MTVHEPETETFTFQAETQELLGLMIHSLYTHKEIFLRELISNASDALDRLRFEALTEPSRVGADEELMIRLDADPAARTLTINDNGVGMSRQELIDNIGTIAKSGTRELMERVRESGSGEGIAELIGQFGVGFYSSFMVAERVVLVTRRAGEETATRWESSGDGRYTLAAGERAGHGTSITLHLKPADEEEGLGDFTDEWVLKRIVKRYSDFIIYPIRLEVEREEPATDEAGKPKEGETRKRREDLTLNSMKPLWARPAGEIGEEEYAEFYKHMAHDWNPPLAHHAQGRGRFGVPGAAVHPGEPPYDLYYLAFEPGLQLYVRRVMIMEHCAELLPRYLRFLRAWSNRRTCRSTSRARSCRATARSRHPRRAGAQGARHAEGDEGGGERQVSPLLGALWPGDEGGGGRRAGIRDRLLELLLFQSSHDPARLTTLADYVGRMKEGQKEIFYLTASRARRSRTRPSSRSSRSGRSRCSTSPTRWTS